MNYLQDVVSFLEAWNWPLILSAIGSGPFLSALGQIIKRNRKLEKWGVIQFMMWALSAAHSLLLLWLSNQAALLPMIGIYAPAVYGYTQAWYPVIKKVDSKISSFLAGLNAQNSQAQDKVLTADTNGEAVYTAPSAAEAPATTPLPESKF